jgi:hypothetical protein
VRPPAVEVAALPVASDPMLEKVISGWVSWWSRTQRFDSAVDKEWVNGCVWADGAAGRPILITIINLYHFSS